MFNTPNIDDIKIVPPNGGSKINAYVLVGKKRKFDCNTKIV